MLTCEQARKALKLSSNAFDGELEDLIAAGVADLSTAGVAEQLEDRLYDNALRNYVRGHFDPSAPDAEASRAIYEHIKGTLKLIDRYRGASDG